MDVCEHCADAPHCQHWILGDIIVAEGAGQAHRYERAILVTFATIEEYRRALRYFDPVFSAIGDR